MSHASKEPQALLGYLAVERLEGWAYQGGYLILDRYGHPLSFHCTEVVEPNRVQVILYGATLERFLLGRHLAGALLAKGRPVPQLVLVNHPAVLQGAKHGEVPLAWIRPEDREFLSGPGQEPSFAPPETSSQVVKFRQWVLQLDKSDPQRLQQVQQVLEAAEESWDLMEPFSRIAQALEEARRAA